MARSRCGAREPVHRGKAGRLCAGRLSAAGDPGAGERGVGDDEHSVSEIMPVAAATRWRRRSGFAPCCCKCSTRSAASGNCASSCATTSSAGSSGWRSMTIWRHSTFSRTRYGLLAHPVVEGFFAEVLRLADSRGLLSKEHFSVVGTLIQAWASSPLAPCARHHRPLIVVTVLGRIALLGSASRAATTSTPARPIRRPGTIARAITRQRCSATKAMR